MSLEVPLTEFQIGHGSAKFLKPEKCSFAARRKARWEIINGGQGPSYCFAHCYSDSSHCIATWLIELLFANGHSVAAPVLI